MRDDEVDDRWLALAALLLSGIEEPMSEPAGPAPEPTPEYRASVTDLTIAHRARRSERDDARSRHPTARRSA